MKDKATTAVFHCPLSGFFFFPFLPQQAISQSAALFGSGAATEARGSENTDRKVAVDTSVQFLFFLLLLQSDRVTLGIHALFT